MVHKDMLRFKNVLCSRYSIAPMHITYCRWHRILFAFVATTSIRVYVAAALLAAHYTYYAYVTTTVVSHILQNESFAVQPLLILLSFWLFSILVACFEFECFDCIFISYCRMISFAFSIETLIRIVSSFHVPWLYELLHSAFDTKDLSFIFRFSLLPPVFILCSSTSFDPTIKPK